MKSIRISGAGHPLWIMDQLQVYIKGWTPQIHWNLPVSCPRHPEVVVVVVGGAVVTAVVVALVPP